MLYLRLSTLFICVILVRTSLSLPIENPQLPEDKNTINEDYIIIDQRQNGTDNVRVNIDGVIIALTPIEALFDGSSLEDFDFLEEFDISTKPADGTTTQSPSSSTLNVTNATPTKKKLKRRRNGVSQLMRTLLGHRRTISKDN